MKKLAITFAAALAATVCASCTAHSPTQPEGGAVEAKPQDPQEKRSEVKTASVTFHVIGMKKTASGAT